MRCRLVQAARHVLNQHQAGELSARRVAKAAGLTLKDFYHCFQSKDELLVALGQELLSELRRSLREVSRAPGRTADDDLRTRAQFERAVRFMAANPAWFRLAVRSQPDIPSPLGRAERQDQGNLRQDILRDLIERGYPNDTPVDTRRLLMMADGYIALTERLAQGHLEGWYPELDEILDVLVMFTKGPQGYRLARQQDAATRPPRRPASPV